MAWMATFRFLTEARDFSLLYNFQTGSEAHPALYPMRTGELFSGGKVPGREADHSSPASAEVRNDVILLPHISSWRGA
jgi:hypothetical protein